MGSYSPSGSTPPGVLPYAPALLESCPFTELAGIQCPVRLDGDIKQHTGGLQHTILDDHLPLHCPGCETGDMVKLDWCPPGVLVGMIHLRVSESHTASQSLMAQGKTWLGAPA